MVDGKTTRTDTGGAPPPAAARSLPVLKKILLAAVITVLFFGLLELGLATFGVRPRFYEDDPYVGFSAHAPLFVPAVAGDGTRMLTTAPNKLQLFNQQAFPASKAAGVVRVFCVGGSTTYGRPYHDPTSFCGWLRRFLAEADPDKSWEVVNAGGISYASYRAAKLMEELIAYQPDLFVIYSGHNEFLERRTYGELIEIPEAVRGMGALLSRTRTYTLMRRGFEAAGQGSKGQESGSPTLAGEVTTLLDDTVGPDAYHRDDDLRDQVLRHYNFNLARMVDMAHSVGARAVLVVPATNLRDCAPFKSEHSAEIDQAEIERWRELVSAARTAHAEGRHEEALSAIEQANAIDDRHAHASFFTGKVLDALGRTAEARAAYERARDEDVCPLRAVGPVPGIVAEVAADRGVPLVDFASLVAQHSADGIPGESLFFDHVHPTIEGHRLLALALLDTLQAEGLVTPPAAWDEAAVERITEEVLDGLDDAARAAALTNESKVLGWAGKLVEAHGLAKRAVELDPDSQHAHYQAGLCADLLGRADESFHHYQRAVEIDPEAALAHGNLAVAFEKKGQLSDAVRHHRLAIEHGAPGDLPRYRANLANVLRWLGYQAYSQGRFTESVPLFSEAIALEPDNADTLDKLGTALLAVGNPRDAAAIFAKALQVTPGNAAVRNRLAVALYLAGQTEESVAQYRQALAADPRLTRAADGLVNYLQRAGRTEDARSVLQQLGDGG